MKKLNTTKSGKPGKKVNEQEDHSDLYENQVKLLGRCSNSGIEKELPSGDKVVEFRIVVKRDDREGYDTFDVALWGAALRKRALSLKEGEWIEVEGALRRRFWKAGNLSVSRWQVEARQLRRI